MITVTNETIGGNVEYTNGEYRITGDYRINPTTKKLDTLNVSINKSEVYAGNVNAYQSGDELQYNYNNMKQENVAAVSVEISSLVSELESRYSEKTLSV
jgi:hypothetical protein